MPLPKHPEELGKAKVKSDEALSKPFSTGAAAIAMG